MQSVEQRICPEVELVTKRNLDTTEYFGIRIVFFVIYIYNLVLDRNVLSSVEKNNRISPETIKQKTSFLVLFGVAQNDRLFVSHNCFNIAAIRYQ